VSGDPAQLLEETATLIGERAAAAAADTGQQDVPATGPSQRFSALLDALERSEFVGTDLPADARVVPANALFVVVGGSTSRPPFEISTFGAALANGLSVRGSPALFVESTQSVWGLVHGVRTDIEARSRTATVDNGETTVGRIAIVLGLDQAIQGNVGHYGVLAGRTGVIPAPSPSG
jgi:hypothetical protein